MKKNIKNLSMLLMIALLLASPQSHSVKIMYQDGPHNSIEIVMGKNKKEVSKIIPLIRKYYTQDISNQKTGGYVVGLILGTFYSSVFTGIGVNQESLSIGSAIFISLGCGHLLGSIFSSITPDKSMLIAQQLTGKDIYHKEVILEKGVEISMPLQELEKLGLLDNSENMKECAPIYIRIIKNTGDQTSSLHGAYIDPAKSYGLVIDGYDNVQFTELKYDTVCHCKAVY